MEWVQSSSNPFHDSWTKLTFTLTFWSKPSIWFSSSSKILCTSLSAAERNKWILFVCLHYLNLDPSNEKQACHLSLIKTPSEQKVALYPWSLRVSHTCPYLQSVRRNASWRWRRSHRWRWWRGHFPSPAGRRHAPSEGLHPDTSEQTRSQPHGWTPLGTEFIFDSLWIVLISIP